MQPNEAGPRVCGTKEERRWSANMGVRSPTYPRSRTEELYKQINQTKQETAHASPASVRVTRSNRSSMTVGDAAS